MGKVGEIQPIRAMAGQKDRANTEQKEVPSRTDHSRVNSVECAGER